jgi:hypothetical protein
MELTQSDATDVAEQAQAYGHFHLFLIKRFDTKQRIVKVNACVLKVLGSNIDRDIVCPHCNICAILFSPYRQILVHYLDYTATASFQILSNSSFIDHPTFRRIFRKTNPFLSSKHIVTFISSWTPTSHESGYPRQVINVDAS